MSRQRRALLSRSHHHAGFGLLSHGRVNCYGASERRACRILCVTRGTYRYRSCCDPRTELRMRIREIAQTRVRYGYRKIRVLLNREGWAVGKHLVYRLYKEHASVR